MFLRKFCWQRPKIKQKLKTALNIAFKEGKRKTKSYKCIGHSMSMILDTKKSNPGSQQWLRLYITKCNKSLLQNASRFLLQNAIVLLQNATIIRKYVDLTAKCNSYFNYYNHGESGLVGLVVSLRIGRISAGLWDLTSLRASGDFWVKLRIKRSD